MSVGGMVTNRKFWSPRHAARRRSPAPYARPGQQRLHARPAGARRSIWPTSWSGWSACTTPVNIAAVIVEPIAGSTGVLVPPKGYLKRLREICTKHGILLIFDEVITGFGRIGSAFAAQEFGVTPDIITMAKGLTNGVVPMGAVLVTQEIYRRLHDGAGGRDRDVPRLHLLRAIRRLRRGPRDPGYLRARGPVPARQGDRPATSRMPLHSLKGLPGVIDVRNYGLVAAIEYEPCAGQARCAWLRHLRARVRGRHPGARRGRYHRAVAAADHREVAHRRALRHPGPGDRLDSWLVSGRNIRPAARPTRPHPARLPGAPPNAGPAMSGGVTACAVNRPSTAGRWKSRQRPGWRSTGCSRDRSSDHCHR